MVVQRRNSPHTKIQINQYRAILAIKLPSILQLGLQHAHHPRIPKPEAQKLNLYISINGSKKLF